MAHSSLFSRFSTNPILKPSDFPPSNSALTVQCVLNPAAFQYGNRTGLLVRVAEGPAPREGWVGTALLDPSAEGGIRLLSIRTDDPELGDHSDPRVFTYRNQAFLTTASHLRLAWSDDGVNFTVEPKPTLVGEGAYEVYGVDDCRVEQVDGRYRLTYSTASEFGVLVGLASTADWKTFTRHGIILPPHNKDVALFPKKIGGAYHAFHRPSGIGLGGNFIWMARSPDLLHWGGHACVAKTRPGKWDGERIGAGAAPILTKRGWLEIYHGADASGRYCLGALLLDLEDPTHVLARSREPIMEPETEYERNGFYGNCVFTNGHVINGDTITLYYGAADSVICGATASLSAILDSLKA